MLGPWRLVQPSGRQGSTAPQSNVYIPSTREGGAGDSSSWQSLDRTTERWQRALYAKGGAEGGCSPQMAASGRPFLPRPAASTWRMRIGDRLKSWHAWRHTCRGNRVGELWISYMTAGLAGACMQAPHAQAHPRFPLRLKHFGLHCKLASLRLNTVCACEAFRHVSQHKQMDMQMEVHHDQAW